MKNKKIFTVLIFFLFILTLSAVSAEDSFTADTNDSVGSILISDESTEISINSIDEKAIDDTENEKISYEKDSNQKILQDNDIGSFDDLANEISNIENGGVLNLSKDYKYQSGSKDGIILNKSITIIGNNHTIDGDGQSRIFNIFKSNVTLKDMILVNGNHDMGGAIFSRDVINCSNILFENNHANNGGAIYIAVGLKLYNCIFDGNEAINGGAIYTLNTINDEDDEESDDPIDDEGNDTSDEPIDDEGNDTSDEPIDDGDEGSDDEGSDDEGGDDEELDPYPVLIENSIFKNTHNTRKGIIYSNLIDPSKIVNSTFANSTTEYGTAIFAKGGSEMFIYNSNFTNLHANKSGGALLYLSFSNGEIENCSFINTSCESNGGAICNSVFNDEIFECGNSLNITNCKFENSKSRYGGAISQAGGLLSIKNSSFEDNNAVYSGGAIQSALCTLNISNSSFKNNKLDYTDFDSNGGAINLFLGNISIDNTDFINNTKNAVYLVDNGHIIKNSFFSENKEAIHSAYDSYSILENNNYTDDSISLNNSDDDVYTYVINNTGKEIKLVNNTFDVKNLPSRFDLREWGWVSPVKDQEDTGACWIFAICAGLESSLLKATEIEYNFSIENIHKNINTFSKYGIINVTQGGYVIAGANYVLSWYGPLPADYEEFDLYGKFSIPQYSNDTIHVQDILWLSPRNINDTNYTQLKEAIIKYGGVSSVGLFDAYDEPYFNKETSAWYYYLPDPEDIKTDEGNSEIVDGEDNNGSDTSIDEGDYNETSDWDDEGDIPDEDDEKTFTNHAICVVGWDDNYPASNFLKTPPGNGAWIIKNSYGADKFDNGFIYVSYYDTRFARDDETVSYIFENTENYSKNYQTDIGGPVTFKSDIENYTYKNSYQSIDDDLISAVGTYFNETGQEYSFEIYVNGELKHSQNGTAPFRGFHTIKLTKNIEIKKGDNFTAVMKTHTLPILKEIFRHFKADTSFADMGNGFEDLSQKNTTAVLKVYTISKENEKPSTRIATTIECKNMTTTAVASVDGRIGKYFTFTLKDINGTPLANKDVKIGFNGKVYDKKTNENGTAKLQINLPKVGTYTFAMGFLGDDDYLGAFAVVKITVTAHVPKLVTPNKSFKVSAKTKTLTGTFKTANGNVVKGKKISFTINGKTYTATTNAKGVASVKVSLSKKGTYTCTAKFAGDNTFKATSTKFKVTIK